MNGLTLLFATVLAAPTSSSRAATVSTDVPVYLAAEVAPETLHEALAEVDRIFAPGDVQWRWTVGPETGAELPLVTVVVQSRPARPLIQGCSRNLHDHRLGHTHLPSRRITIWTEQVARAIDGDWDETEVPRVDERLLARALGRVLAHELGHLFLRSSDHQERGLMRSSLSRRSLIARTARRVRLSRRDLESIYASLSENREAVAATPP